MDDLEEFQALVHAAFLEESAELLATIDVALQHLQVADGDGSDHLVVVKRSLHTLKGSAAAAGNAPVARLVHGWESDLEMEDVRAEAQLERLDQLRAILDGEPVPAPVAEEAPPAPPAQPEPPDTPAPPVAKAAPAPLPDVVSPPSSAVPTGGGMRPVPSPNARAADVRVPSRRIQELDRALGDHLVLHLRSREQLARTVHTRDRLGDVLRCHRALRDALRTLRRTPCDEGWEQVEGLLEQLGDPLREVYRDTWQDVRAESERLDQGANVGSRLRHSVHSLGLMPVQPVLEDLGRVLRHAAQVAGRRVALEVVNSPVQIERAVLEQLTDALQHLVRNAVAHGIEAPEARERAGKDPVGRVTLQAEGMGGTAVIRVSDDGRGVDAAAVNARARQLGLGEARDAAGLLRILTTSGVSTRAQADAIAGRGVGMDVVASRIAELGGQLTLDNRPGQGCTFVLTVPVRSRSDRGMVVDVGGARYAIPQGRIERVVRLDPNRIRTLQGAEVFDFDGPVSVLALASLLGGRAAPLGQDTVEGVLLRHGADRLVLLVDEILDEQTLVLRPLPPAFAASSLLDGGALQADGTAIPVLSVRGLLQHARGRTSTGLTEQVQASRERQMPRALVVDDSITMRTLQRNILHAAGYRVEVATDGQHGLEMLQGEGPFDVLVVDLEMPRMNGTELCRAVRRSPDLKDLPIVMVTSIADPAQRAAAMQAGADDYIVKGHFEQGAFLACVSRLVGAGV